MKAWTIREHGSLDGLALVDWPEPDSLGAHEVRVSVRAVSLNFRDLLTLQQARPGNIPPPLVPCSDGAGEVIAVGSAVTEWKPGDRVAGLFFQDWGDGRFDMAYHRAALGGSAHGMLLQQVVLPEHGLVRVPDSLSHAEAACLPCAALTAWTGLFTRGQLKAGDTVLVLGTGGVSIFALQFAHAAGARVIVTSSSAEKLVRARQMGAWETINYIEIPGWDGEVQRLTGNRGVDHVVEVGGPGTLGRSMASVAAGGHIALIGVLTGFGASDATLFPLVARNATMSGIYVGSRADFAGMNEFIEKHGLHPSIDREYAWDEAPEAFRRMEAGAHLGKIVIRVG